MTRLRDRTSFHYWRPFHALMYTRAALTAPLVLAGLVTLLLALGACGYQRLLGDYRLIVESYKTEMAA